MELEVGVAGAVHQVECDCLAVVRDVDDLIGGRTVFALDQVAALRGARREVKLG
jgi:hypothetical protein